MAGGDHEVVYQACYEREIGQIIAGTIHIQQQTHPEGMENIETKKGSNSYTKSGT